MVTISGFDFKIDSFKPSPILKNERFYGGSNPVIKTRLARKGRFSHELGLGSRYSREHSLAGSKRTLGRFRSLSYRISERPSLSESLPSVTTVIETVANRNAISRDDTSAKKSGVEDLDEVFADGAHVDPDAVDRITGETNSERSYTDSILKDILISDSEEYDTDLEDNFRTEVKVCRPHVGDDVYEEQCRKERVFPQWTILKQLKNSTLNVNYRQLGPRGFRPLAIALAKNAFVENLRLKENGLGEEGFVFVSELLKGNDFIEQLDISENNSGPIGAYHIADALQTCKWLKWLNISGNKIKDDGIRYLAAVLVTHQCLETVDISFNEIEHAGKELGSALRKQMSIVNFNINHNNISGVSALELLKGLQGNTKMQRLDISHNGLGYQGAVALGKLLKVNKTLRDLNVSCNNLNWNCAVVISDGLKVNNTLISLRIGDNPLTTNGSQSLIEAVTYKACALQRLELKRVTVVGEFEVLALAVRHLRVFEYEHGGIVLSHDLVGMKRETIDNPMQRMIGFMRDRGLRPHDVFRAMDKQGKLKISKEEFADRLRRSGMKLERYELDELFQKLHVDGEEGGGGINYRNVIHSVRRERVKRQRIEAARKQRLKLLDQYHKKLLSDDEFTQMSSLLDEQEARDDERLWSGGLTSMSKGTELSRQNSSRALMNSSRDVFDMNQTFLLRRKTQTDEPRRTDSTLPPLDLEKSRRYLPADVSSSTEGLMSMAGQLGGKVKAFGTTAIEKPKKKRKKKRKHKNNKK